MPDHKLQATFKLGAGYDEAWVTVASDDTNEFANLVQVFRDQLSNTVADAAQIVRATNEAYRAGIVATSNPSPVVSQPVQQAPAPSQQVPTVTYTQPVTAVAPGPLPNGVTISNDGVNAYIEFPFNRAFNDVVKGIGGRFDKTSKRWYVPASNEGQLRAVAVQHLA